MNGLASRSLEIFGYRRPRVARISVYGQLPMEESRTVGH